MKMVYICSPLRGDIDENIKNAVCYSKDAANQGVLPLAPHTIFTQYLNDLIPAERQQGLKMGLELLARCDELWVYGSLISEGMQAEILYAKEHNMPIKYQEEGNAMNASLMKRPHIVGYYKQTITTKEVGVVKVIPAVMLQYPHGIQQLTTGLLYSTPSEEYMSKWNAVERLSTRDLCTMQNSIQNAIRADPLFDTPDNRLLIQLLQAETSENTFSIYQLKNDSDMKNFRFTPLNQLPSGSNSVNPSNYDFIYTAPLAESITLEEVYEKFNIDHPEDFTGRSLSISDVVVLHQNSQDSAYYVDRFGFKELAKFDLNLVYEQNRQQKQSAVMEKLNRMQQETGARPFVFTAGEEPLVSLPAEADDYLTPEEKREAVELISKQNQCAEQADQQMEAEQDEADTQDFEEDYGMDMTL